MTLGECKPGQTGYITDSGRVHKATIFEYRSGELGADCGGFVLRLNQTSLTGLRELYATPREATDVLIARLNSECADLEHASVNLASNNAPTVADSKEEI